MTIPPPSAEAVKRYDIHEHSYDVQFLRESIDGDYVKFVAYDALTTRLARAEEALKAWEHWYSVDSTEFNRDMARAAGRKALAASKGTGK